VNKPLMLLRRSWPLLLVVAVVAVGLVFYRPKDPSGAPQGLAPGIALPLVGTNEPSAPAPEQQTAGEDSPVDPLYQEAQQAAEDYFRPRIIQCGDSRYFYQTNWLSEAKGNHDVSASGAPPARREITLADSLNGVRQSPLSWDGTAILHFDALHVAASEHGAIIRPATRPIGSRIRRSAIPCGRTLPGGKSRPTCGRSRATMCSAS